MAALGEKYAGKPNKYLTGSIEKAKAIIKQYEANLKACPSACDMSTEALEARLLGKGDWTKNNSLIFDHANDCKSCGGGCRPSCQLNACPNEKMLSNKANKIGSEIYAKGCCNSCNTSGASIINSCGLGCLSELESGLGGSGESEEKVGDLAQKLSEAMNNIDESLF